MAQTYMVIFHWRYSYFIGDHDDLPSGELTFCYGKIHFSWENPLFLWPFSIAMLVHQRVSIKKRPGDFSIALLVLPDCCIERAREVATFNCRMQEGQLQLQKIE